MRGVDVLVAGITLLIGFCSMLFFSALAFTPPPPEDFATNPDALQLNVDAILNVYETQLITLYSFTAINFAIGLMLGIGYIGLRLRGDWSKLGVRQLDPAAVIYALTMGTAGGLGIRGGTLLAMGLSGELGGFRQTVIGLLDSTPTLITFVGLMLWVIVLPFLQEMFFRGVVYSWLRQFRGPWGAMLVNGLINGVFNLFLVDFFSSVLIAFALAYIYERTGSVLGAYLAHSTLNFVTIVLYVGVVAFGG